MRLYTDFNYQERENHVWTDLDEAAYFFHEDLRPGKKASLFDGTHECMGTVVQVDRENRMVELRLDLSTWRSLRTW
jgi:hypothetical protein